MKSLLTMLFLLALLNGCAPVPCAPDDSQCQICPVEMEAINNNPDKILIIGDSLSINYTQPMKDLFSDHQVIHNECNGRNTRHGLKNIERWANHYEGNWKICTINHGMWDVMRNAWPYVPIDEYANNLKAEIAILETKCEKIIFPNTTHLPENHSYENRRPEDIDDYNNAAETAMNDLGIPVCDLFSVSETITHLHDFPDLQNDVHFGYEGGLELAKELKRCIDIN